jgi:transcriptional regulator
MYIPRHNAETRVPVLHRLIRANPLAALVTLNASGLIASHIPMVLEAGATEAEFGTLRGHVSLANSQWRELSETTDALAIFAGPHHYISTEWYPGTYEDGKEVPTWNYAVVHACGPVRVIHDAAWLLAHVSTLTDEHEAGMPKPWKVGDAPQDFIASQLKGIVGLEIQIRGLEGKWKVSQNRTQAERKGVIAGLAQLDTPGSLAMSEMVANALHEKPRN